MGCAVCTLCASVYLTFLSDFGHALWRRKRMLRFDGSLKRTIILQLVMSEGSRGGVQACPITVSQISQMISQL